MSEATTKAPEEKIGHVSGFVSILGRPNAGKSTLMNSLIGTKLSIVADKPQTTRNIVQGVLTTPRGQVVFLVALAVLGALRDYQWAARLPELIVFAPGVGTIFADAACWAGLTGLAQAVMRWVAGPARSDPLARRPGKPAPHEAKHED